MLTDKPAEPPSLTRTFEKTADQKIIDLNFKALTFIAGLFYKPLATASDPFLRNDLGERYFTSTSAWFGGALWLAAAVASLKISVVPVILLFFNAPRLASWAIGAN